MDIYLTLVEVFENKWVCGRGGVDEERAQLASNFLDCHPLQMVLNRPSIIKPMNSLQCTSFLDLHLNSGFTPQFWILDPLHVLPPLLGGGKTLKNKKNYGSLIYVKNTFCQQIGPKQPLLVSAVTNIIYRLLYGVATTN